jgi:altronate hydrolase
MTPFIRLHPADDVLIARAQLVGGTQVENITVRGLIPAGHKIATRALAAGEPVRRYNQIIGFASKPSRPASTCTRTTSTWARTKATSRATTPSAPT